MTDRVEIQRIERWLTDIVIGMNLCPFASHPWKQGAVRIKLSDSDNYRGVEEDLLAELERLNTSEPTQIETTLLATINIFSDFLDYYLFLDQANALLKREGLKGKIQIASFHPQYQFSGTDVNDIENFTNRAPYPIFHLIREDSLQKAIEHYPDTESIYQNNIQKMQALTEEEVRKLFSYDNK